MRRAIAIATICLAAPAHALDPGVPGATLATQQESAGDSVRLPRGAWQPDTTVPVTEGALRRTVYQIANPNLTTLQIIDPLRTTLTDAGYEETFTCADQACGGFDFRFQLDLLPAPEMFVDLGNYRYLLMEHPTNDPKSVALVASSSVDVGYLHVTEVSSFESFGPVEATTAPETTSTEAPDLISTLVDTGHVVLADLDFATGSADLSAGPYASLATLANWLGDTPGARVVLVGHTDSVGALDANLALSQRRAQSVQTRLVSGLGASAGQVAADGAGALSPIASNLTPEGRAANRRVEVVLLSLE
ncbi:MAG: OmpA family protein [Pseudomonadota bacterium]